METVTATALYIAIIGGPLVIAALAWNNGPETSQRKRSDLVKSVDKLNKEGEK